MNVTVRRAILPDDYEGIVRVRNAESPEWPTTPAALAHEDATRDPDLYHATFVAIDSNTNSIIGAGVVGHDPMAHRAGKFKINIRVPPELQGQGIGSTLYPVLIEYLAPQHPRELQTEVWETLDNAIRFVTRRGFREVWRRIDSRLDVSRFDFTPYYEFASRLTLAGIEMTTYAELADDALRLQKLYELDRELWQSIPYGEPVPPKTMARFANEEVGDPSFLPEACFIAVHNGEFVGYSNLSGHGDHFVNEMTGVLPAYRGCGLATLLKLRTIEYARAHGGLEIRTTNDSVNEAMSRLNAKLGFVRDGATIRFLKTISE